MIAVELTAVSPRARNVRCTDERSVLDLTSVILIPWLMTAAPAVLFVELTAMRMRSR